MCEDNPEISLLDEKENGYAIEKNKKTKRKKEQHHKFTHTPMLTYKENVSSLFLHNQSGFSNELSLSG